MRSSEPPRNRSIYLEQSVKLDWDYSYDVSIAGTAITIGTSAWESDNDVVTLSGAATSGDTTSVVCVASNTGIATVRNKVTLSNSRILVRIYTIKVSDPMATSSTDYP